MQYSNNFLPIIHSKVTNDGRGSSILIFLSDNHCILGQVFVPRDLQVERRRSLHDPSTEIVCNITYGSNYKHYKNNEYMTTKDFQSLNHYIQIYKPCVVM